MRKAMRMVGRVPLGSIAALLLGGAGGFVAWAIPARLIGGAMRHLHVIDLLPRAAPPYSPLTRIGLAAAVGIVLAALVLLGFRRLETGRWPWSRDVEDDLVEDDEMPLPRLRRFDRHPDAPARRPLFATELLLEKPGRDEAAEAPALDLTTWSESAEPAPTITRAPLFADPEPELPEPVAVAEEEPAPPAPVDEPALARVVAPVPAPAPTAGASIAELMARLEAGLARRATAAAPDPIPVPLGDALRDALADLQQMARR